MAQRLATPTRALFSLFKKKLQPVHTAEYKTPEALYSSLAQFESGLTELELLKMPKTLENSFSKKMRRLLRQKDRKVIDVELTLSHTFENYTRNVDELIFGSEEVELETSLEQMAALTAQMVKCDLTAYVRELIPKSESHRTLYERLLERFANIEERIAREIFQGYFGFSRNVSKVAFLEEREYRGDFKFALVSDTAKIETAIEAMYHCALFNQMRDKLSLACELAISTRLNDLSSLSVSRLLFCLASAGRTLKFVEQNFHAIREKVEAYPLELLYYMMVSGIEDGVWFQLLSNKLVLQPTNIHEQAVAQMVQLIRKERFACTIEVQAKQQLGMGTLQREGEQFFEQFLTRNNYVYTASHHELFPHTVYDIQGKKFICYDHWLVKDESLVLNGIGLAIKQYFHEKNEGVKHLNWPRMLAMDKRGPREEYILSKFKGMERPRKEKVRYYE